MKGGATNGESKDPNARSEWNIPLPTEIPSPTYAPAATAFGITFFFWGFVASPILLGVGFLVIVVALAGWIGEMRHGD